MKCFESEEEKLELNMYENKERARWKILQLYFGWSERQPKKLRTTNAAYPDFEFYLHDSHRLAPHPLIFIFSKYSPLVKSHKSAATIELKLHSTSRYWK